MTQDEVAQFLADHQHLTVISDTGGQQGQGKQGGGIIQPVSGNTPSDKRLTKVKDHKYHVAPKEERIYNGVLYASKKEANFAQTLDLRKKAGEIQFWLRQVPFALPGDSVYRLDFMTFVQVFDCLENNEPQWTWQIEFIEVKGFKTKVGELKRKLCQETYHISIKVE